MNPSRRLPLAVALAGSLVAVPAQQFDAGAIYLMSPLHTLPSGQGYAGIARIDPFTGAATQLVQFTSNGGFLIGGACYDPFRDRIVAFCPLAATGVAALYAIDAAGGSTVIPSPGLQRLAPRGDGKIYGCRPGTAGVDSQKVFYLDAAAQTHELLDVGGTQPWLLNGGVPFPSASAIQAIVYEPTENALFLALAGDNTVPGCGAPSFDISIRRLPLTADGTALRAPATCASYDVGGPTAANIYERAMGFSHGPGGTLVLGVYVNWSGAMPRLLSIDPATAAITPFATVGPYYGDIFVDGAVYSSLTGRALVLDGFNDVWRSYAPGSGGTGQVLAPYGPPGLAGGLSSTLFEVGPIGPSRTLTADTTSLSVAAGGVQNLDFHPGPQLAGDLYLILGSLSGWSPGFPFGGVHVSLNPDFYTEFSLGYANSPFLVATFGIVPPSGVTQAQVNWPAGALSGLQGQTMHHVALGFDFGLSPTHASNPVPLVLLP